MPHASDGTVIDGDLSETVIPRPSRQGGTAGCRVIVVSLRFLGEGLHRMRGGL